MTTRRNRGAAARRVPFADCHIAHESRANAEAVLASGWVTTGPQVAAFESAFAERVGAAHAVAVSSCTAGLELSLRALDLPAGAPVLVSTLTFCGAVQSILHAGLQPVLVDVSPVTGMPTPDTTRAAADRCRGAAAMMVVHWAGDPADVPALAAAAGLPLDRVVEDAAHAVGTSWAGRPVGSGADASFSFYATKNLPIGEGGMVTTNDPHRGAWLRRARLHGMSADAWGRYLPGGSWRYDVPEAGLKANMTDLQAAIGLGQLRHLDRWQELRARHAARYDRALADIPGLALPHRPEAGAGRHAWHLYPVRVLGGGRRDDVVAALSEAGIGTSVHFIPVHHLSWFRQHADFPSRGLPGADRVFEQLISLPMYPRLGEDQIDRVCEALADALRTPAPTVPAQRLASVTASLVGGAR